MSREIGLGDGYRTVADGGNAVVVVGAFAGVRANSARCCGEKLETTGPAKGMAKNHEVGRELAERCC